jgi:hypothetical protein
MSVVYRVFTMSESQYLQAQEWVGEQTKKCNKARREKYSANTFFNSDSTDGNITVSFTWTGIGTVIRIENHLTVEELDLTEYETW